MTQNLRLTFVLCLRAEYNKRERESLIAFNLQLLSKIPVDHPCLPDVIENMCEFISTYHTSIQIETDVADVADAEVLPNGHPELIDEHSIGSLSLGNEAQVGAKARASLTLMHQNSKLLFLSAQVLHAWTKCDGWAVVSGTCFVPLRSLLLVKYESFTCEG